MVPIGTCGQPKESLFVEQAILKGKRGEKATAMKTLKRGWDYIVTFRVIFSYNVSYTSGPKVPCVISLKYVKYCWANFPVWGVQVKSGFPVCCHIQDARNVCGRHHYQRSRDREPRKRDLVPPPPHLFHKHKNALTGACSLACLEIRSRNEEAINSTRNMLYSLKVFYFLLYRRRYFLFVSELI